MRPQRLLASEAWSREVTRRERMLRNDPLQQWFNRSGSTHDPQDLSAQGARKAARAGVL